MQISTRILQHRPSNVVAATAVLVATASCLTIATAVDGGVRQVERLGLDKPLADTATMLDRLRPATAQTSTSVLPLASSSAASSGFKYVSGDRLKITFYEPLVSDPGSSTRPGSRSLVERTELSGEYLVQLDGNVFVPIIGAIRIGQRTPVEAEAALARQAESVIGDSLKVSISVIEREPIYIMGALPRAGTHKYVPGMVVAHVVSLSGGESAGGQTWQQIDIAREKERMQKSIERLKTQLAVLDVLNAEKRRETPQPSDRLVELVGLAVAKGLVSVAQETRELERNRNALQMNALDMLIVATRTDLSASRERLDEISGTVVERTKRRDELLARVKRGVTPENLMVQARSELAEVQTRWHELRTSVARGEMRLLELERDRDQTRLSAQIDLEHQLRTARQTISEEEVMISTIGQVLLRLRPATVSGAGPRDVAYRLVRRTPSGPVQLAADMMTPLEPGDVIEVVALEQGAAAVASLSSKSQ